MATIQIDFRKIDKGIASLELLRAAMDEPSFQDLQFWLGDVSGSGRVHDEMMDFGVKTIDFYRALHALIANTEAYLKLVRQLEKTDQSIAGSL